MKKHEFLDLLWACLDGVPSAEKIKLIEYYNELYFDKRDSGEPEESIVAGFGAPADAAEKYLSELRAGENADTNADKSVKNENKNAHFDANQAGDGADKPKPRQSNTPQQGMPQQNNLPSTPQQNTSQQSVPQQDMQQPQQNDAPAAKKSIFKNKTFWTIYFAGFVITFPITAAIFGVGIGLIAAVFGIGIGLTASAFAICLAMVACVAAGLYGIASSIWIMPDNFSVGLVQLGISFAAIAIGLAGIYVSIKLFKFAVMLLKRRKRHGKH